MMTNWKKSVRRFLVSQTVSLFGSSLVQYAITWHVTLLTKDGVQMAVVTACGFLPQLFISLFGGVWADRYSRKKLIMLADGAIALSTLVLAVLFSMGYDGLLLIYITSIIRSLGAGIQTPAVSALLPDIVPEAHLMRVNGINASIQSVMMLLAPAAAGLLYERIGMAPVFWVDVVTAAIGITMMAGLKVPARVARQAPDKDYMLTDMKESFAYLKSTRWLYQFMLFYLVFMLLGGPIMTLTPLMVARSFGEEPWRLVAHEMVFAGGSILGGLALSVIGSRFKNQMHLLLASCAVFAVTTFILGFSKNFWFYLAVMVPMGVAMPFVNSSFMTIMQRRVEPGMMGRMFGFVSIVMTAAVPLSTIIFGPLANVIDVETELIATGLLMTALTFYMFRFPEIIRAGEPIDSNAAASDSGFD